MKATREAWKPVAGHEGTYEVSDHGRVRSLDRETVRSDGVRRNLRGKAMKTPANAAGYPVVRLHQGPTSRLRYVHDLVAEAFLGPRPDGTEVCHRNGNASDARAANLRYGSPTSNNGDKIQHDTHRRGERTVTAVLTAELVREARARWESGEATMWAMAREYGVNYGTLRSAVKRHSWAWLE